MDLNNVKGFGPAIIKKIGKFKTPQEILDRPDLELTEMQRYGLKIAKEYNATTRYPLEYGMEAFKAFKSHMGVSMVLAGSLRRKRKDGINDIDILYFSKIPDVAALRIVERIKKWRKVEFVSHSGKTKLSFYVRFKGFVIQFDMRIMLPETKAAALAYFTGSQMFNIRMRRQAKVKGYLLNEYGLFERKTKKPIPVRNEHELFDKIGMKYVAPINRS